MQDYLFSILFFVVIMGIWIDTVYTEIKDPTKNTLYARITIWFFLGLNRTNHGAESLGIIEKLVSWITRGKIRPGFVTVLLSDTNIVIIPITYATLSVLGASEGLDKIIGITPYVSGLSVVAIIAINNTKDKIIQKSSSTKKEEEHIDNMFQKIITLWMVLIGQTLVLINSTGIFNETEVDLIADKIALMITIIMAVEAVITMTGKMAMETMIIIQDEEKEKKQ